MGARGPPHSLIRSLAVSEDYQTPLSPGDRLDRYELICPIASGGMASVWVARLKGKHGFEKLFAVKTILPQFASDTRFRAMFLDEAALLSQIQHVNVAQINDVGEERDILYLVMEFVDGDSFSKLLKAILTQDMQMPIGVVLRVLADACLGLHAAHELKDKKTGAPVGLVHRDVSPQNILITQQGTTKLIDFGIAKAKGRLTQETNAGAIKGKIAYMAPEQAAGKGIDRRADVWAVGAILYALYSRRTPYEGETELDTLHALVAGKDPRPLDSDVPTAVRDIAMRATRHSPEERYATALDLSRALESAMLAVGQPTTQADVATFMATHMKDRAASRQKALNFALKAAADRERVRELLTPESDEMTSSSDGLGRRDQRIAAAELHDSLPPPSLGSDPSSSARAALARARADAEARGGAASVPDARVRVAGTLAYEDANLVNARTAFKSEHPIAAAAPAVRTKLGDGLIAPPPPAPSTGRAPASEIPDLIVPAQSQRKPPPPPLERPPPSPFDMEDEDPNFVIPAHRIASAAGSILGPDVTGWPAPEGAPPPPPVPTRTLHAAQMPKAQGIALDTRPDDAPPQKASMTLGKGPMNDEAPAAGDFFDPMAIAAKRAAEPATSRNSSIPLSHSGSPGGEMLGASRPLRAAVADTQGELRRAREAKSAPKARWKLPAAIAAVVAVVVGVGIVSAPSYAKSQAISAAGQQGIVLTIERATVGWGTVHFYGLAMSSADMPSIKMTAASAVLELRGFDADTIVVQDPSVTLTGAAEEVEGAALKLALRAAAGTGKAKKVSLQNGRITWTGPLGEGSRFDAEGVGLDAVRGATGLGDEAHFTAPSTRITTARGVLGPWRLDADRTPRQTRLRIGFDPVLADGPSASLVRGDAGTTATLKITRQPLSRLGIPHGFLGLVADEQTQMEATMQVSRPLPNRVVGDVSATLFDARITPQSPKLDLGLKGSFAGDPAHPLDTSRTQLSFGPLVANALGAVTLLDESFRVELKWAVSPLPCGVLTKKTSTLQASAAGLIGFDSRHPDQADFKLTQASTCGLPIFPSL